METPTNVKLMSKPPGNDSPRDSRLRRWMNKMKVNCASTPPQRSPSPPYSVERGCQTSLIEETVPPISKLRLYPSHSHAEIKRSSRLYSSELEKVLSDYAHLGLFISQGQTLEAQLRTSFADPARTYREGKRKCSFCYILLDPRQLTRLYNMRNENLTDLQQLLLLIEGIFYIGKGTKARPHQHLKDAAEARSKENDKIDRIREIWAADEGVQSLHVFMDVIPAEAYTREASMIDAIQLENLTNLKSGQYYGVALEQWTDVQRRIFGVYLLYTALLQFRLDGYKPLRRIDVVDDDD